MSSVDRMMQGKPAGQFDENTIDTIKSILSGHDDALEHDCAECSVTTEAGSEDGWSGVLRPVSDVQPQPKLSAQAVLDAQEEALLTGAYPLDPPKPTPVASPEADLVIEPDVTEPELEPEARIAVVPAEAEAEFEPVAATLAEDLQTDAADGDDDATLCAEIDAMAAELARDEDSAPAAGEAKFVAAQDAATGAVTEDATDEPTDDLTDNRVDADIAAAAARAMEFAEVAAAPQELEGVAHPEITDAAIAQIVKRDKHKRKRRRKGGIKRGFAMMAAPFVAVYRSVRALMRGTAATATGMADGIAWVRVSLVRLKTWFEPHLTRRRVFLLAYVALFALKPWLMFALTLLFFLLVGWAFFRHGPDRVWFGVFRLIAQYSEVNSEDAALMRNRFDRFAERWNSAARFLPENAAQSIAVPDFEALDAQDRAHEAAMADRLLRMHSQV